MKIKKNSKRPVKASKHMKLGRKIMASTGKNIPYDLVSMAAILRDWADMPRDAYASDEHKLLADIADTLYNVGKESAKTFQKKYAELYKQYGEAYFDQVLDDMAALDSQVSSKNIEELVEDYEDRLDSGIGAATKIRASRASRVMAAKRSIHFLVTVTDTDEIIDVLEDQDKAIEVAQKYTQKYGDSATVEKEWIGSDGEVYDSTVCFQTDGNFNSSTKIAKRRAVRASSWGIDDPRSDYLESKHFRKVVFNGRGQYDRGYTKAYPVAGHRIGHISVNPRDEYAVDVDIMDTNYVDHRIDIPSGIPTNLSPENYENDLASIEDFLYNYDLNEYGYARASTKITKRPIKASRPIMAGAGAGYNIEWSLNSITSVQSFTPISTEVDQYGDVVVDAECDIDADITINAANSYYDGASDLDLDTTAKISRIAIEIYVGDDESADDVIANLPYMNAQELDSILYSMGATTGGDHHSGEWKSSLGGGWIHSTFNGVLADADDPHSVSEGMDGWTITLTDKEVIDYIDQVVTGEDTYTGYALYDQDGEYIDKFENLMDAQNKAEELIASGEYESIECVREDTKIYFDGTSEEVYNETEFVIDEPADI